MNKIIVMNIKDNVATCLSDLKVGEVLDITVETSRKKIALKEDIPFGHKFALTSIKSGQEIIKYGEVIGVASRAIKAGQHVHVHNIESLRARGDRQ
jgi:altronate dehydratase small subunit